MHTANTKEEKTKGTTLRRMAHAALFFPFLLFMGIGAMGAFVHTERGTAWISQRISSVLPGKIEFKDLSFTPLTGEISVSLLKIATPEGDTVLSIKRLSLELGLSKLFSKGALCIENLLIDTPEISLILNQKNRLTIMDAFIRKKANDEGKSEKPESKNATPFVPPINILLNRLSIVHGRVQYRAAHHHMDAEISDINLKGNGNLFDQTLTVSGLMGFGHVQIPPYYQTAVEKGSFRATLKGQTLQVDCISIDGETFTFSTHGKIDTLFTTPRFQATVDVSRFDLASLFTDLFLELDLSGTIYGRITVSGDLDNPEATLFLVHETGNLFVCEMDRVTLEAAMKDKKVRVSRLSATKNGGGAEITGNVDLSRMFPDGFISLNVIPGFLSATLHLIANTFDLKAIPLIDPNRIQGVVDGGIDLSLDGVNPKKFLLKGKTALTVGALHLSGYDHPVPVTLVLDGHIKEGILSVKQLDLKETGAAINASGKLDLFGETGVLLDVGVKIDPEKTPPPNPLSDLKGILSSQIKISGTLQKPELFLIAASKSLSVDTIVIGDIFAQVTLSPQGRLRIEEVTIKNRNSLIKGKGEGDILHNFRLNKQGAIALDVTLENAELKDFITNLEAKGRMEGQMTLSGTLQSPMAKGAISAQETGYGKYSTGALDLTFGFQNKTATIDRATLKKGGSEIAGNGFIRIFDDGLFQIRKNPEFHLETEKGVVALEDFFSPLKGAVSLEANLNGTIRDPRGKIKISGKNMDLKYQTIDEAIFDLTMQNKTLTAKAFRISPRLGQSIIGNGWISLEGAHAYEFDLGADKFPLTQVDPLYKNGVSGYLDLSFSGKGLLSSPQMDGTLRLTGLMQDENRMDDMALDLSIKKNRLTLNGGGSDFSVKGGMDLTSKRYQLDARFDATDMTPYIRMAGRKEELRLNLDGRISSEGEMDDPQSFSLDIDLKGIDFRFQDLFFLSTKSFKGRCRKGLIRIEPCRFSLPENGYLDLNGQMALEGPLDLSMAGQIPLQMATPFTKELSDLSGDIKISAHLGGTVKSPDIDARISLKEAGFVVLGLEQRIDAIDGQVDISNQTVEIDHITGQIEKGRFRLNGNLIFDGLTPVSLSGAFTAAELPITVPDTMSMILNSDVKIDGSREKATATGEITLVEGTYYKNHTLNLVQGISRRDRPTKPASPEIDLPFLKNLDLDIAIKPQRPFVVDNNLAHLEVMSDLRIGGKLNTPVIKGRTAIREGEVFYFKKTFVVEKGIIDFLNPYRTDPTLAVKANTTVRDWTISLDISGPPDNLVCDLSSSPQANHEDILSLLVVGQTVSEIETSNPAAASPPEQMLAELLVSTLDTRLKEKTGLDIIELYRTDTSTSKNSPIDSDSDSERSDQMSLLVGKELSPRLILKYAVENSDQGINQKTMAEYKFLEHILLNGFQDSKGNYGGELQLKIEFR